MKWMGILVALWALEGWALDIDEKLTLRILKLSKSKKTILINRGVEDGLQVGDHAKFYLTTGMLARGVVLKTSPARSVWSLYRLIDPTHLVKDKVLNLKVATPLKISSDPSKMIMVEPVAVPGEDIPLSPDAESLSMVATSYDGGDGGDGGDEGDEGDGGDGGDENQLESLGGDGKDQDLPFEGKRMTKTWEVMGLGHLSYFTSTLESKSSPPHEDDTKQSGSDGNYDLSFGIEKYFAGSRWWYERFSFFGLFRLRKDGITNIDGAILSTTFWGLGVGLSYHFSHYPQKTGRPIIYGTSSFGIGEIQSHSKGPPLEDQEVTQEIDLKGGIGFFNLGLGVKYYRGQWGSKIELGYEQRVESYTVEHTDPDRKEEKTKVVNGGSLLLGILYRF